MIPDWLKSYAGCTELAALAAAGVTVAVLLNLLLRLCYRMIISRQTANGEPNCQTQNGRAETQPSFPCGDSAQTLVCERADTPVREEVLDLFEMAAQLRGRFQEILERRGCSLVVELPDVDVCQVTGDRDGISGILEILMNEVYENIVSGEVRVIFRQMYRDHEKINLMLRIRATGSSSERYGGGEQRIVQAEQLVRRMKGQLWVSRIPEGGSDFGVYITLRLQEGK